MGVWDFIQDQMLGMKWLNELLGIGLSALGLDVNGRIGGSVQFFIYDVLKITVLLCVLIFAISYIQSYFPPERSKRILGRFHGIWANIIRSVGDSNPLLLLFLYSTVHRFYQCGVALGCDVLLFDFITDGRFRKSCLVNEHFRCKSGDRLCDPWACYRSCRRHHD